MKKRFFTILFLFVGSLNFLFSVQTLDTIVLLDTSESMFGYFSSSVDYLIQDIIRNQLKQGDTFHLLSFADTPEYEISKKIITSGDIESILSRILILKPLGKYTDLISALEYVNNYTGKLSPATRKKIIILTDGIHDPPPSSSYFSGTEDVFNKVKLITENMKRQGWDVSLIRFPLSGGASGNPAQKTDKEIDSGNGKEDTAVDLFPELSRELKTDIIEYEPDSTALSHKATGAPLIIFPDNLGEVGRSFVIPFKVKNYRSGSVQVKLKAVMAGDADILEDEVMTVVKPESTSALDARVRLPESYSPGSYDLSVDLVFPDDTRPYPRKGTIGFILVDTGTSVSVGRILKIALYIIVLLSLILLMILVIRKFSYSLSSGTVRPRAGVPGSRVSGTEISVTRDKPGDLVKTSSSKGGVSAVHNTREYSGSFETHNLKDGGKAYEMLVQNQNRHVGGRNINILRDGSVLTVGGAQSDDYLIFIYPVESRIAEIEVRNGTAYLKPLRKEFFPEISSERVAIESGEITVISLDSRTFRILFKEWIPPAERVNRILHLIDNPGIPDFEY